MNNEIMVIRRTILRNSIIIILFYYYYIIEYYSITNNFARLGGQIESVHQWFDEISLIYVELVSTRIYKSNEFRYDGG